MLTFYIVDQKGGNTMGSPEDMVDHKGGDTKGSPEDMEATVETRRKE